MSGTRGPADYCGGGMGAGEGVGDDCAGVLHDVWLFLDNELDPERRAAIQQHLDDCSPCLEQAGIDTKLKELLARKCGGDQAPAHLRERIVTRLVAWRADAGEADVAGTAVTVSVERSVEREPE